MSDARGAQAIGAVTRGDVRALPSARVFRVRGSSGDVHTVVLYVRPIGAALTATGQHVCTCFAGQHGRRCWHTRAAELAHQAARDGVALPEPTVGDLEPDRL